MLARHLLIPRSETKAGRNFPPLSLIPPKGNQFCSAHKNLNIGETISQSEKLLSRQSHQKIACPFNRLTPSNFPNKETHPPASNASREDFSKLEPRLSLFPSVIRSTWKTQTRGMDPGRAGFSRRAWKSGVKKPAKSRAFLRRRNAAGANIPVSFSFSDPHPLCVNLND